MPSSGGASWCSTAASWSSERLSRPKTKGRRFVRRPFFFGNGRMCRPLYTWGGRLSPAPGSVSGRVILCHSPLRPGGSLRPLVPYRAGRFSASPLSGRAALTDPPPRTVVISGAGAAPTSRPRRGSRRADARPSIPAPCWPATDRPRWPRCHPRGAAQCGS